jgi:protein-S-isoprenylcysteine O-methyltransferase Ste14
LHGSVAVEFGGPQSFHSRRFRWRSAIGIALLVPAAVISLFSEPLTGPGSLMHLALFALAWPAFVAGTACRFWATAHIGGRKERELVTDGPYAVCRHPLYLGSVLLGLSGGLFLESPLFLIGVLTAVPAYINTTIAVEEAVLRARHGTSHEAYVRAVPRLLPRALIVRAPAHLTVDVHRMWLECLRASRWTWLPVAGAVFTYLRSLASWPKVFRWL